MRAARAAQRTSGSDAGGGGGDGGSGGSVARKKGKSSKGSKSAGRRSKAKQNRTSSANQSDTGGAFGVGDANALTYDMDAINSDFNLLLSPALDDFPGRGTGTIASVGGGAGGGTDVIDEDMADLWAVMPSRAQPHMVPLAASPALAGPELEYNIEDELKYRAEATGRMGMAAGTEEVHGTNPYEVYHQSAAYHSVPTAVPGGHRIPVYATYELEEDEAKAHAGLGLGDENQPKGLYAVTEALPGPAHGHLPAGGVSVTGREGGYTMSGSQYGLTPRQHAHVLEQIRGTPGSTMGAVGSMSHTAESRKMRPSGGERPGSARQQLNASPIPTQTGGGSGGGGGGGRTVRTALTRGTEATAGSTVGQSPAVVPEMIGGTGVEVLDDRTRLYLPRAMLPNGGLTIALGMEVDQDGSYWQHYTTRHDPQRYAELCATIKDTFVKEFNAGRRTGNLIAVYDRPPPARCGAFEVTLTVSDSTHVQHILLHSKLFSGKFPNLRNLVQRAHNIVGSKRSSYSKAMSGTKVKKSMRKDTAMDKYTETADKSSALFDESLYETQRCVRCGGPFSKADNHAKACLPWGGDYSNPSHIPRWGPTSFSCKFYPDTKYTAHQPFTKLKIYVDVVDVKRPHISYPHTRVELQGQPIEHGHAHVDPVNHTMVRHYTPGQNPPLTTVPSCDLRSAMVNVPDLVTLKVISERYEQKNWLEPFELSYHGPMIMTVEISFNSVIVVRVRDIDGQPLDDADALLQCKSEGLKYLLGTATPTKEREAFIEVPCTYVVSAKLDGYVQTTNIVPFNLTGEAWSLDGSDPLEIEVKMLKLAIEVEVVDAYGHVFTDVETEALQMIITKDRPRDGGWRPDSYKPMVAQRSLGRGGLNSKSGLDVLMQPNPKHQDVALEKVPLKPKNVPSKLETKAALFGTLLSRVDQREFSLACEYNDYEVSHVKVGGRGRLESPSGLALEPADWGSMGEHGVGAGPMQPLKLSVVMCRYDLVVLVNDEDDAESNITEGVKVTLVPTGNEWEYHADEIPLSIGHDVAGAGVNRFSKSDLNKAAGRYNLKIETPDEGSWEYEVRKVTRSPMMTDEGLGTVVLGELTAEMDANEEDLIIDLDLDPRLWSAGQPTTTFQVLIRYSPKPNMEDFKVLPPAPKTDSFDICFIMDATGSMGPYIDAARDSVLGIASDLEATYPKQKRRFAVVAYRDLDPSTPKNTEYPVELLGFTSDVCEVRDFFAALVPTGGHDIPEDLLAGLDTALKLDWQATTRTAIMIADAPCHGQRFHKFDDHFPHEPDPHGLTADGLLTGFKRVGIDMFLARINPATDQMISEFRKVNEVLELTLDGQETSDIAENFRKLAVRAIGETLVASVAVSWSITEHPTQGRIPLERFELAYMTNRTWSPEKVKDRKDWHKIPMDEAWGAKGWQTAILPDFATTHTLRIPAAVPTVFKIRAFCSNGDVTDFSEPLEVLVGLDGAPDNTPPPPALASVRVQSSNSVECVRFKFVDTTTKVYGREEMGEEKQEELVLEAGDYIVEVNGLNSAGPPTCESIEFVTMLGRRMRYDGAKVLRNSSSASAMQAFCHKAKEGYRVCGLVINPDSFCQVQAVEEEPVPPPPVGIHTKIKYEDEPNWVGMGGAEAVAGGAGAGRERTATKGGADTPKSATGGGGGEGADGFSLAGTSVANTSMVVPNLRSVPTTPSVSCDLIFHNNSEVRVKCFWADTRGKEVEYFCLAPNLTRQMSSAAGHCWVVRSERTDELMCSLTAGTEEEQTVYIGTLTKELTKQRKEAKKRAELRRRKAAAKARTEGGLHPNLVGSVATGESPATGKVSGASR
mmetsp:Transcript_34366/g.79480  ORF Transcript_34366/g.79480 Transcript_34366/m.79480 type:complete len:1819 (+) Transcript_34366:217-5673(+)